LTQKKLLLLLLSASSSSESRPIIIIIIIIIRHIHRFSDMIPPTIRVPISYGDGTHVAIDSRSLPTRAEDVLGVLQSELAPLSVWMECAKAYLADENEEAFLEIVGSGCSPGKRRTAFALRPLFLSIRFFIIAGRSGTRASHAKGFCRNAIGFGNRESSRSMRVNEFFARARNEIH